MPDLVFRLRLLILLPLGAFIWSAQKLGFNPWGVNDKVYYDSNSGLEITEKPDGRVFFRFF